MLEENKKKKDTTDTQKLIINKYKKEIDDLEIKLNVLTLELEATKKLKDDAVMNEYNLRQQIDSYKSEADRFRIENESLKITLNRLADLFEESHSLFKDSSSIISVIDRNLKNSLELLENKINLFNSPKKGE